VDTTNDEGWIRLHRKIIESQVFQSEGLLKVWIWCLLKANHKDRWVQIKLGRGTTEVFVKRGQFIFGRETAAKELKMVERTVHKRMLKLETMRNCDIQSDTHYSIVTILNYEPYQSSQNREVTGKVTAKGQPRDTNKNDKNEKKYIGRSKNPPDPRVKEFERYWGETFQKETGQPYTFSYGKEGKLLKTLLQVHPIETLQDTAKLFFRDEQCKRRGLTLGIFFQEVNRLVGKEAMNPLEQAKREMAQTRASGEHAQSKSFKRNPIEQLEDILQEEKRV
jgi:hypothetical protein